jgi:hypothetical protein
VVEQGSVDTPAVDLPAQNNPSHHYQQLADQAAAESMVAGPATSVMAGCKSLFEHVRMVGMAL